MLIFPCRIYNNNINSAYMTKTNHPISFGGLAVSAYNFQDLTKYMFNRRNFPIILVKWDIGYQDVNSMVEKWYSKGGDKNGGFIFPYGGRYFFEEFHNSHLTEDSSIDRKNFLNYLKKYIDKKPFEIKILDAGCGEGKELQAFKKLGYQCFGFDASQDCVNMAKLNSRADIIKATFNNYKSPNKFDAIFARKSLQHVPKSAFLPALQNMINHLNPNGFLFVVTKLDNYPINGVGRQLFNKNRLFHNFLTEQEIHNYSSKIHDAKLLHMETAINPNIYDRTDTTNVSFILRKI